MKLGNAVGIPRPVSSRMGGHVSISNTGKYARFLKLELGASGFRRIPVFSKIRVPFPKIYGDFCSAIQASR